MKHSLRTRLILSFLGIIIATAGLVVLLANRITADRFTYMVSNTGQMRAQILAPLFADYYAQVGSWMDVESLVESYLDAGWFLPSWQSDGSSGSMMGATDTDEGRGRRGGPMMGMMGTQAGRGWQGSPMMSMMEVDGERLLLADVNGRVVADSAGQDNYTRLSAADLNKGAPILIGGERVGTLIVASGLGTLTSDQSAFLAQVKRLMVAAAIIAGLAVLLIGSFQARRIVAPVRALADAARRVAGGDLSQRIPVTSQDELGEMAAAFNMMAAELERQHVLRRRAMSDIAHELRTPLSVLQIDLESIEDGLTEPTPDVVARLQEEVVLLNRLVEDLRTLSLAEAGELQIEVQPLDVGELARTTVERVQRAAREKDVTLSIELSESLSPASGDRQRLAQVLLNLLSNALRHTSAGGQITVAARQGRSKEIQVTVQDTGEGVPASELPYIFERFYRTDRARSRDSGGSGLGLAIARSLVEAHGGRIWAESVEGQGSIFTFTLPTSTR